MNQTITKININHMSEYLQKIISKPRPYPEYIPLYENITDIKEKALRLLNENQIPKEQYIDIISSLKPTEEPLDNYLNFITTKGYIRVPVYQAYSA